MSKCAYCNCLLEPETKTREHAPPKSFFLPGADNLITITCCLKCNAIKSKDDEYAKTVILMMDLMDYHPEYEPLVRSIVRSLERPQKKHFSRFIIGNCFPEKQHGSDSEELMVHQYDERRLTNWAALNAQAVLYSEGMIPNCNMPSRTVMLNEGLAEMKDVINVVIPITRIQKPTIIGSGEYRYWIIPQDKNVQIIVQVYYQEIYYLTVVGEMLAQQGFELDALTGAR